MIRLEVAVGDILGLQQAVAGGADRVELCSALEIGGLTPSVGLMQAASGCGVPCYAMIRPRSGGFCYDAAELVVMEGDIAAARAAGLAGVVFGALTPDGALDLPAMRRLCDAAAGMGVTLHRAFDLTVDWRAALDEAVGLGMERILTSGHAVSVAQGLDRLAEVVAYAAGRIGVMPGAGVGLALVPDLRALGVAEVHASCGVALTGDARNRALGFEIAGAKRTDARAVADLRAALG